MKNVVFVKDMKSNLVSCNKATENNKFISEGKITKFFEKSGKITAVALKHNGLLIMKSKIKSDSSHTFPWPRVNIANKDTNNLSKKEKWHRLLGHVNFKYLDILCINQLLDGIPKELENEFMKCKTCIINA